MRRLIATAALLALPVPALAHAGHAHAANERPGWTLAPSVVIPLGVLLALYLAGLARSPVRSDRGLAALRQGAGRFLLGWGLLAGALLSPLHEAGERSFALHMVEHELIMLPAALLLVAGRPGPVLLWGLPAAIRKLIAPALRWSMWQWLATPVVATALQAAALVLWHMPALFDRALRSEGWHVAQHLSFVTTALLFWWAVLPRGDRQGDGRALVAALCLFVTSVVGGGLGALMALAASPWYPAYAAMGGSALGLTPEQDQQLAGTIMWVPGGAFHLAAALFLLARALRPQARKLSAKT